MSKPTSTPKLALSVPEAAEAVGLSRDLLDDLIAAGEVRSVKVGRRRIVPVVELSRWLERAARVTVEADR